MYAGAKGTAYSGILPGQDDEAVAYHSTGGVSGSSGGSYCNPSDWFCNDLTLGTAANEGGSAKWSYHSVVVPRRRRELQPLRQRQLGRHRRRGAQRGGEQCPTKRPKLALAAAGVAIVAALAAVVLAAVGARGGGRRRAAAAPRRGGCRAPQFVGQAGGQPALPRRPPNAPSALRSCWPSSSSTGRPDLLQLPREHQVPGVARARSPSIPTRSIRTGR